MTIVTVDAAGKYTVQTLQIKYILFLLSFFLYCPFLSLLHFSFAIYFVLPIYVTTCALNAFLLRLKIFTFFSNNFIAMPVTNIFPLFTHLFFFFFFNAFYLYINVLRVSIHTCRHNNSKILLS